MLISTLYIRKVEVVLLGCCAEKTVEYLIGIGMTLVDIVATMATKKIVDNDLKGKVTLGHSHLAIGEGSICAYTTGTSDEDFTLVLRVEVEQDITIHKTALHGHSARETSLLINGKHALDGTMLDAIIGEHGKCSSHTDTIIGTQCGTIGLEPVAINNETDGVGHKVVINALVALTHHIHVRLQDDGLAVFHTGCGRLADNDVASLIDLGGQAVRLAELTQPSTHLLLMLRRMRDATNFFKIAKQS